MTTPYAPQPGERQPQHAPYAVAPPKSTKRTFGIWSLVLGLSGLLLPIFVNSIAAIVLGIVGLTKEQSKGMAIAGIVSGAFCLLIVAPIAVVLIVTAGAALPFILLYAPFFTA